MDRTEAPASFFWHDYETFGRDPRRTRPSQFAGVRTNLELDEIEEGVSWFCQPAPDFVPEPQSVLLTGITPQQALAQGLPEPEFAQRIERALGAPGTIGVGFNSIRFDDEFTRFLFWRNLLDPYAREWRNGCSRWDLLDVLRCCWALRPEGIEWPRGEEGRAVSFRLELLTAANGLAHEKAHDALSDVRATLALARLVRERKRPLWDFCLKLRKKEAVWAELGTHRPVLHISSRYGPEKGCMAVVWPLAAHPTNKNEVLAWDLAADPSELEQLTPEVVRQRLFTRVEDLPEGLSRLPIKSIHVNKSPIVIGNLKTLGPARERFAIDLDQAQRHADKAAALPDLRQLWAQVFKRPQGEGVPDVDQDLYGGFVSDEDRKSLNRLLPLSPQALASKRLAFEDGRLEELVFRYRARNYASSLSEEEAQRWQQHRAERLEQGDGVSLTLAQALDQIDGLALAAEERGDERAGDLLSSLVDYLQEIAP